MKIFSYIVLFIIGAVLSFIILSRKVPSLSYNFAKIELIHNASIVEKKLETLSNSMSQQLVEFSNVVSKDRDFTMKLLVEKNSLAPEVTEIASKFIKPMGLSFLELCDDKNVIISSGHFPANAGNKLDKRISENKKDAVFLFENVLGNKTLTFQTQSNFSCFNTTLTSKGGYIVDSTFVNNLNLHKGTKLFFKIDKNIVGTDSVNTISPIHENIIIINDIKYLAIAIPINLINPDAEVELILTMDFPKKMSIANLF